MNNEINLLIKQGRDAIGEKTLLTFRIVAGIFILVLFLLSAVVFFLKLRSPIPLLKKQEEAALAVLLDMKIKTSKYILLTNKIRDIANIVQIQSHYDNTLASLRKEFPQDAVADSIKINGKNIELTMHFASLGSVNTFLNTITEQALKKELFKTITLSGLNFDPQSQNYNLSLKASLL